MYIQQSFSIYTFYGDHGDLKDVKNFSRPHQYSECGIPLGTYRTFDDACRAFNLIAKALFSASMVAGNYVELEENEVCCGRRACFDFSKSDVIKQQEGYTEETDGEEIQEENNQKVYAVAIDGNTYPYHRALLGIYDTMETATQAFDLIKEALSSSLWYGFNPLDYIELTEGYDIKKGVGKQLDCLMFTKTTTFPKTIREKGWDKPYNQSTDEGFIREQKRLREQGVIPGNYRNQ